MIVPHENVPRLPCQRSLLPLVPFLVSATEVHVAPKFVLYTTRALTAACIGQVSVLIHISVLGVMLPLAGKLLVLPIHCTSIVGVFPSLSGSLTFLVLVAA